MTGPERSTAHLSLHVGSDWMVRCSTYPETTPILSVDTGGTALMITPTGQDADEAAVQFARELARKAQQFADEVERIYAAQHAPTEDATSAGQAA